MITQIGERVVFVYADDDRDDHEFLAEAIKTSSYQYEIKPVYDGEELIKFLSENTFKVEPAFLVVDLNMPKVDGLTAIRHIKTKLKHCQFPIYLLSTSGDAETRLKAALLGVEYFYTKPTNTMELKDIIEEMTLTASKFQER